VCVCVCGFCVCIVIDNPNLETVTVYNSSYTLLAHIVLPRLLELRLEISGRGGHDGLLGIAYAALRNAFRHIPLLKHLELTFSECDTVRPEHATIVWDVPQLEVLTMHIRTENEHAVAVMPAVNAPLLVRFSTGGVDLRSAFSVASTSPLLCRWDCSDSVYHYKKADKAWWYDTLDKTTTTRLEQLTIDTYIGSKLLLTFLRRCPHLHTLNCSVRTSTISYTTRQILFSCAKLTNCTVKSRPRVPRPPQVCFLPLAVLPSIPPRVTKTIALCSDNDRVSDDDDGGGGGGGEAHSGDDNGGEVKLSVSRSPFNLPSIVTAATLTIFAVSDVGADFWRRVQCPVLENYQQYGSVTYDVAHLLHSCPTLKSLTLNIGPDSSCTAPMSSMSTSSAMPRSLSTSSSPSMTVVGLFLEAENDRLLMELLQWTPRLHTLQSRSHTPSYSASALIASAARLSRLRTLYFICPRPALPPHLDTETFTELVRALPSLNNLQLPRDDQGSAEALRDALLAVSPSLRVLLC
jgi:hypothetical protein